MFQDDAPGCSKMDIVCRSIVPYRSPNFPSATWLWRWLVSSAAVQTNKQGSVRTIAMLSASRCTSSRLVVLWKQLSRYRTHHNSCTGCPSFILIYGPANFFHMDMLGKNRGIERQATCSACTNLYSCQIGSFEHKSWNSFLLRNCVNNWVRQTESKSEPKTKAETETGVVTVAGTG